MPGNLASNDLATFSASGRSTEVYQTTLPSFFAASMSCGVTALAGGAAESTRVEGRAVAAASALVAFSTLRRDQIGVFIFKSSLFDSPIVTSPAWGEVRGGSAGQRVAALRRHLQPHRATGRQALLRGGDDAQLG